MQYMVLYTRDLRPIGGLPTLLGLLGSEEASLRTRAAAIIGASAQNNEPVQQVKTLPAHTIAHSFSIKLTGRVDDCAL